MHCLFSRFHVIPLLCAVMFLGMTSQPVHAQDASPSLQELFRQGRPGAFIQNMRVVDEDAKILPDKERGNILRLTFHNEAYAEFRPMPVTPGRAYELTYEFRWDSDQAIEANPALEMALAYSRAIAQIEVLPVLQVVFLNERKEPLTDFLSAYLVYSQWRPGRIAFIAPPEAQHVMLKVKSARNDGPLLLANLAFNGRQDVVAADGYRFDLRQQSLDQTGHLWGNRLDMAVRQDADGSFPVYSAYGDFRLGSLSLSKPGQYRLTITGTPQGKGSRAFLTFTDDQGKAIRGANLSFLPEKLQEGVVFPAPADAKAVTIAIRDMRIAQVQLTRQE